MNNRYICKAKRKDNGEWVEGYYVCNGEHCYIFSGKLGIINKSFNWERYEVAHETVGQCTGLKDKNGKWIFEGDIVRTKHYGKIIGNRNVAGYDIFKVVYVYAMFRTENKNRAYNLVDGGQYEVIGNIHDNPELLEVER